MSAKTKIVVLHMKELIYTVIFVGLGILLIILLICMFLPKDKKESVETAKYVPGVYTSTITFQDQTMDVQVVVDESQIKSVSLVNLSETVTTMYPLMETTMDSIGEQIVSNQSLENVTYTTENQYTTTVLVNAVGEALEKASTGDYVENEPKKDGTVETETTENATTTGQEESISTESTATGSTDVQTNTQTSETTENTQ